MRRELGLPVPPQAVRANNTVRLNCARNARTFEFMLMGASWECALPPIPAPAQLQAGPPPTPYPMRPPSCAA